MSADHSHPGQPSSSSKRTEGAFRQVWLTQGFRPFFLAAGVWAVIAIPLWVAMLATGFTLPSKFDPLDWHIHEMLFGFVMAAIGGFLLTAVPNWTGRLPLSGAPLAGLAGLWLLGRVVCLVSAFLPDWLTICADLSFPVVLVAVLAREIIAGKNWHNLRMLGPVVVLAIANLLMHLEAIGIDVPTGLGWRLGVMATSALVSAVAGRIVPSFTRNWLMKHPATPLPAASGWVDRTALGTLHAGLLGWVIWPDSRLAGAILLIGAAFNLWRLLRWRGYATAAEPLLLILHIGYGWVILGAALLGLSLLGANVPESAAIHALTVGAMGTMILAVMTRATRGHTGRKLTADAGTRLIYILVSLAAITRILAALSSDWIITLLVISASFWVGAYGMFLICYGTMLLCPRDAK